MAKFLTLQFRQWPTLHKEISIAGQNQWWLHVSLSFWYVWYEEWLILCRAGVQMKAFCLSVYRIPVEKPGNLYTIFLHQWNCFYWPYGIFILKWALRWRCPSKHELKDKVKDSSRQKYLNVSCNLKEANDILFHIYWHLSSPGRVYWCAVFSIPVSCVLQSPQC